MGFTFSMLVRNQNKAESGADLPHERDDRVFAYDLRWGHSIHALAERIGLGRCNDATTNTIKIAGQSLCC